MDKIREIQLDLLQDWLNIILIAKEKNPKAVADTLMSMQAVDKSILKIQQEMIKMLESEKCEPLHGQVNCWCNDCKIIEETNKIIDKIISDMHSKIMGIKPVKKLIEEA